MGLLSPPGDVGRDGDCSTLNRSLLNSCTIPLLSLPQDLFHCQIMDGNLSRNLETYFPLIGNALYPNQLLCGHGARVAQRWGPTASRSAVAGWDLGLLLGHLVPCPEKAAGRAAVGRASPIPSLGHIQIAQVPGRHEPDSPGELNFSYIFEFLESLGYTGYVGCEYAPKGGWPDPHGQVPAWTRWLGPVQRQTCPWGGGRQWASTSLPGDESPAQNSSCSSLPGVPGGDTLSVTAGDTLEGLGWLRSYWESRGLQHGGTSKAAE